MTARVIGTAIDDHDDEWTVDCPQCGEYMHFRGFFDPEDECTCPRCKTKFKVERVYFSDGSYMK
jgi:uncharacterized protein (DUF983 family)